MPIHNRIPTEELIADLHRVADKLGRPPSRVEYRKHGDHAASTQRKRFGTWSDAKREAGWKVSPNTHSADELLADLERVGELVGGNPSIDDYREHGMASISTYQSRFGSWAEAKAAAGYERSNPRGLGKGELLADLRRVADELGYSPSQREYDKHGKHSSYTVKDRFGLWNEAKNAAGLAERTTRRLSLEGHSPEDFGLSEIGDRDMAGDD